MPEPIVLSFHLTPKEEETASLVAQGYTKSRSQHISGSRAHVSEFSSQRSPTRPIWMHRETRGYKSRSGGTEPPPLRNAIAHSNYAGMV